MGKLSYYISAMAVAKFAHELRIPIGLAIDRLYKDSGITSSDPENNDLYMFKEDIATGSDSVYLHQVKRKLIKALLDVRKYTHTGGKAADDALVDIFNAKSGNALKKAILDAFKEYDVFDSGTLYGNLTNWHLKNGANNNPAVVTVSADGENDIFNVVSGGEITGPGVVIKGTDLGIGEQAASENLLVVESTSVSNNNGGTIYFDFIDFSKTDETGNDYRTDQVGDYSQNIGCYSLNDYDINPLTLGEEAQWLRVRCPTEYSGSVVDYANDHRTVSYAFCEFFATLEPGEYKVVIEGINLINNGIDYWNTTYNGPYSKQNKPGWFALVDSNNNQIIPKTCMLQSNTIVPYSDIYYDSDFPIANLYFDLSKYGPDPSSSWGSYWDGTRYWLRTGFNGSAWEETSTFFNHNIYYKSSRWSGLANEVYYPRGVYSYSIWVKTDTSGGESAEIYITEHELAYYYNTERGIAKDVATDLDHKTIQIGTSWSLVSVTFEVTTAGYLTIRVEKTVENGNNIYVTCPVVVKGSKPHAPVRYDRFVHEEYPFTLTEQKQVGLMHVLYQGGADFVLGAPLTMPRAVVYTRFMICRADLDSDPFAFAYNYPGSSYSADFSGWTNFQPSGEVGGATLTGTLTNLLNNKTYTEVIRVPSRLTSNDTAVIFTHTDEITAALGDGESALTHGLVSIDILDTDSSGDKATIVQTRYLR